MSNVTSLFLALAFMNIVGLVMNIASGFSFGIVFSFVMLLIAFIGFLVTSEEGEGK